MSSTRERLGAIATFLQHEEDELLYWPQGPSSRVPPVSGCPFPHPQQVPEIVGERGLTTCPCCGAQGKPLGCDDWYTDTDQNGERYYTRTYCCEGACGYSAWTHWYRVAAQGRHLAYAHTESFGAQYAWTMERTTVPDVLKVPLNE